MHPYATANIISICIVYMYFEVDFSSLVVHNESIRCVQLFATPTVHQHLCKWFSRSMCVGLFLDSAMFHWFVYPYDKTTLTFSFIVSFCFQLGYNCFRASQVVLVIKNPPASAGDTRDSFHPWVGEIPWRRKWHPTPVFLPEKVHGQRKLADYIVHGIAKSGTWLRDWAKAW